MTKAADFLMNKTGFYPAILLALLLASGGCSKRSEDAARLAGKGTQIAKNKFDGVSGATPWVVPYVTNKNSFAANPQLGPGSDLKAAVARIKHAVVSVGILESSLAGIHLRNTGSGVIVDSRGYILTSYQAIEGNPSPRVILFAADHKHQFVAQIIAADPEHNLALIKITAPDPLPKAVLGDSQLIEPGMWVMAMGSADGLSQRVVPGVVSSTSRSVRVGRKTIRNLVETNIRDLPPGIVGGPLLDTDGRVIGIHVSKTMILPINDAGFMLQIAFTGPGSAADQSVPLLTGTWAARTKVSVAWLGADVLPMNPMLAKRLQAPKSGLLVNSVVAGSPADDAGLMRGDVLTRFGAKRVTGVAQMGRMVKRAKPGSLVDIAVVRDGKDLKLSMTVEAKPVGAAALIPSPAVPAATEVDWFGMEFSNLTKGRAARFKIDPLETGVVVIAAPALVRQATGIKQGDLVRAVNGNPVADMDQFLVAASEIHNGGVVLDILRNGQPLYITVEKR